MKLMFACLNCGYEINEEEEKVGFCQACGCPIGDVDDYDNDLMFWDSLNS